MNEIYTKTNKYGWTYCIITNILDECVNTDFNIKQPTHLYYWKNPNGKLILSIRGLGKTIGQVIINNSVDKIICDIIVDFNQWFFDNKLVEDTKQKLLSLIGYKLIEKEVNNEMMYAPKIYKVITLCGSTKFKTQFEETVKELTLQGNIVISVGCFGHSGDNEVWTDEVKEMLDDMHKRKILMANEIYVIDVDGYIGESTRSEIEFAESKNIPIRYYSMEKHK